MYLGGTSKVEKVILIHYDTRKHFEGDTSGEGENELFVGVH